MSTLSVSWLHLNEEPLSKRVGDDMAIVTPKALASFPISLNRSDLVQSRTFHSVFALRM